LGGIASVGFLAGAIALTAGCGPRNYRYKRLPAPTRPPSVPRGGPSRPAPAPSAPSATQLPPPAAEAGWEPPVRSRPWQWIVLHHSATHKGSAASFDWWHRHKNHWDELGYHFVIGNGTRSGDGEIEIGSRWPKQKHGAHCRVGNDQTYNQTGVGICLVGDFRKAHPTVAQMQALARLVDWLTARYGIADSHVIGHGDVDVTSCPGRHFSREDLMRRIRIRREARRQAVATSGY
jgi:hypothetical protein